MRFLVLYGLPGLFLLGLAFYAGSHSNPTLGLFGFLAFFVAAVTLWREGLRKTRPPKD
jgi:hypothetical protein